MEKFMNDKIIKVKKGGEIFDCRLIRIYSNGKCRIEILHYNDKGEYSGYEPAVVKQTSLIMEN